MSAIGKGKRRTEAVEFSSDRRHIMTRSETSYATAASQRGST